MKNLALFSSSLPENSLNSLDALHQGDRFRVVLNISDSPSPEYEARIAPSGLSLSVFGPELWNASGDEMLSLLSAANVEILILENLDRQLPAEVASAYEGKIITADAGTPLPVALTNLLLEIDSNPAEPRDNDTIWAEKLQMKAPEPPAVPLRGHTPPAPPAPAQPSIGNLPPQYDTQNVGYTGPQPPKPQMPPAYLVVSVLVTLLCCVPGIAAIIYSSKVSSRYYAGDYDGARRASEYAQIWIIVAFVLGVIGNSLILPFQIF